MSHFHDFLVAIKMMTVLWITSVSLSKTFFLLFFNVETYWMDARQKNSVMRKGDIVLIKLLLLLTNHTYKLNGCNIIYSLMSYDNYYILASIFDVRYQWMLLLLELKACMLLFTELWTFHCIYVQIPRSLIKNL